jgi:hypothetical protein
MHVIIDRKVEGMGKSKIEWFLAIIVAERGGFVYLIYRLLPWDSFAW